jgi:excisionase family DNA binding protein
MPETFEPLASAEEAAVYLRIHAKTLRRLAREGRVPSRLEKGRAMAGP